MRPLFYVIIGMMAVASGRTGSAVAETRAAFISGTFVLEGRCPALAALEAGGDRNVGTVPETLTAEGFSSWEGGCGFSSVTETEKGRRWRATLSCAEGAEEWTEDDLFDLDPATGRISVTVGGKTSVYERCDVAKGN